MVRKLVLSLLAVLSVCAIAQAQNRQLSGTVKTTDGAPVVGATVAVDGTGRGTTSGSDGSFVVSAPVDGSLTVSFIGYKTQHIAVAGKTAVAIVLEEDTHAIDDVIVVAYGTSSKEAITGAVSMVKSADIEKRTASDVTSTLEGTSAGVQVSSSYGEPGATAEILIRGYGSINGNNTPLYVVDGNIFSGSMSDLNPNDIESISILKDAASAALYGSRAASGVVLITTKKGRTPHRINVNVSTKQGVYTRGLKEYETLSADPWMEAMWNTLYNDFTLAYAGQLDDAGIRAEVNRYLITGHIKKNIYDAPNEAVFDANGKVIAKRLPGYTDLDWFDEIERTGYRGEYNIQADAAGENFDVFASVNYLNEEGYVKNSDFERTTGRLQANFRPKEWFKAGVTLSGSIQKRNFNPMAYGAYYANPFYAARMMAPVYPVFLHDEAGDIVRDENGKAVYDTTSEYLDNRNIAYELDADYSRTTRTTLNASAYASFTFLKNFEFTVRGSVDRRHSTQKEFNNAEIGDGATSGGRLSKTAYKYNTINFQQQLTYDQNFGKHHVDVMVGHENFNYGYDYDYTMKSSQGLPTDVFDAFATMQNIDGQTDKYRSESYLARGRYNYDERYFVEASWRRDGSSRFAKDARWGNFWSIGGSWVASAEEFMKNAKWVDFLKLRASYGEIGNDASAGYYASLSTYTSAYGIIGGNSTIFANQLGNPNLKWETTQSFDIGIDARLWNRVDVTLDYFKKRSKDLLFDVNLAPSIGTLAPDNSYPTIAQNIGSVDNSGIELAVNVDLIRTKNWHWDFGVNASFVKNKVKTLPASAETGNGYISGLYRFEEGHSMYEFYLYQYRGVDQLTGRALYAFDTEKYDPADYADGTNAIQIGDDYYAINTTYAKRDWSGEALPDVYGGLQTNVTWKNLTLNVLCSYSIGGKIYDSTYRSLMYPYLKGPQALHRDILNSWTAAPEGMTADSPNRISQSVLPMNDTEHANYTYAASNRWLKDASYFIVKNIGITYELPKSWMKKIGLGGASVSFNVENPFIFTSRQGMNPQYSIGQGSQDQTFVAARVWTFGLNLKL